MTDPVATLREALADRYAFERELGRGGMATVYLARDVRHDRPVALKVLHPELAASLGNDRFQREIKLAARLQHPHILTVLDSGDAGGRLWFTMPFVEGESLRDRLRRERQLPVEDAVRIARETADALGYAHRHDVVHRDIKPENILLTGEGHTLVADFGIARALDTGSDERLTETGMSIGTPAYMSPEQAAGDRGLDARTDIYSLGAVLFEMLAGEPPYTGATIQALMAKRLTEPVPSVRGVRPSLPEALDQAVRKALAPVAADRFSNAAQFAAALAAAPAVTSPSTAIPATPAANREPASETTGPRPRPRGVPVAATALVLGILIGLGVLFAWRRSTGGFADRNGHKVLAVLPFENLGDSADAYFADGVTDEVRTKLAQVVGLEVIARGSSLEYRGTVKRPAEIARELGADYLLTGTVRWEKAAGAASRVRVTPELVDARPGQTARTRWGQQFDAALTNVFQVQADIATRVADALDVALADSVRSELVAQPTASLEAYDAFLKGEAASAGMTSLDIPSVQRALPHYQRAVTLDSSFVPAWAQLSRAYASLYSNRGPTPELAELARQSAERARRLGPTRPEGFLALGFYHRGVVGDQRQALAAFEAGLKLASNNVELIVAVGSIEQAAGRWEESLARYQRAAALDPRSGSAARRYALSLLSLRRYPEAEAAQARALTLAPTSLSVIHQAAMLALAQGDRGRAERIARTVPPGVDSLELAVQFARYEELGWLLSDAQQRLLLSLPPSAFEEDGANFGFVLAQLHALRGQPALARVYADSARMAYEKTLAAVPDDGQQRALLGLTLAFQGRWDQAVREGERGVELMPISRDAYLGPYNQLLLARVHMMAGNHDKAVELLAPLVEVPNNLSRAWLRVDPTYDPLRKHSGFQKLVDDAR